MLREGFVRQSVGRCDNSGNLLPKGSNIGLCLHQQIAETFAFRRRDWLQHARIHKKDTVDVVAKSREHTPCEIRSRRGTRDDRTPVLDLE